MNVRSTYYSLAVKNTLKQVIHIQSMLQSSICQILVDLINHFFNLQNNLILIIFWLTDFRLFCLFVALMSMISYQGTVLVLLDLFKCFFYFYSLYIVSVVSKHVCTILIEKKNLFVYLRVQLIEKVYCIYHDCNIEDILWDREKYWQPQSLTKVKGMNSIPDLYSAKRKGCRKH